MDSHASRSADPGSESPPLIRSRIPNACDGCKARKVKCDGKQPCSYCSRRRRPHACHYTPQRRTRQRRSRAADQNNNVSLPRSPPVSARHSTRSRLPPSPSPSRGGVRPPTSDDRPRSYGRRQSVMESAEDDTEVPREARLLFDAQGKLIFIGDCAPLSFFQSVRQLVNSRVGQAAFAPETSRYSVLENAPRQATASGTAHGNIPPSIQPAGVSRSVRNYLSTTAGLLELFDEFKLVDNLVLWANLDHRPPDLTSTINYLILAIGHLKDDEETSQDYFGYAREQAFGSVSADLSVGTVQAFILVSVYMLCSCQVNSAFLVFGIAARAAYSIGLHRTEVNSRFGPEVHRQRDRLWKSLRIVDMLLSTSMGRPPATSDIDCTVPYRSVQDDGMEEFDILNASVQIILVTESIAVEIYSRKKISLQLTEGISLKLRDWSTSWLQRLKEIVAIPSSHSGSQLNGACLVLSSYYYAVMLVSRPFLMYELWRRLGDAPVGPGGYQNMASGKSKLADACIDAASLMVETTVDLIEQGVLDGSRPMLVLWLFSSSLVLGLGLLGGFGRILEKYTRMSIQALEHFALSDTHARQYSLIAQSLLNTAIEHLEKRELQERLQRTESSSQLFGLIPHGTPPRTGSSPARQPLSQMSRSPAVTSTPGPRNPSERQSVGLGHLQPMGSLLGGDSDSPLFGMADSMVAQDESFWNMYQGNEGDAASAFNLFPLLDAGGGIDLAHYL